VDDDVFKNREVMRSSMHFAHLRLCSVSEP